MLLGCYRNLAFVLFFLGEEIIDLFLVWQARHHWVLACKLAVISVTGVGIDGRGTLRQLKLQYTWESAQHNCVCRWWVSLWKERHAEGYFIPLSPSLILNLFFLMGIHKSIVYASD
jgi:hypothetical protein